MDDPICHHPDCADVERLRDALRGLIHDVQEWCEAVDADSSWDGWDHHYKALYYNGGLDTYRAALDATGKPLSQHPDSSEPQTPEEWKLLAGKLTDEIEEWREKQVTATTAAMLLASKMAAKFYPEATRYDPPADLCTLLAHIEDMTSGLVRKPQTTPPKKGVPQ